MIQKTIPDLIYIVDANKYVPKIITNIKHKLRGPK